jgi:hypothetical protein
VATLAKSSDCADVTVASGRGIAVACRRGIAIASGHVTVAAACVAVALITVVMVAVAVAIITIVVATAAFIATGVFIAAAGFIATAVFIVMAVFVALLVLIALGVFVALAIFITALAVMCGVATAGRIVLTGLIDVAILVVVRAFAGLVDCSVIVVVRTIGKGVTGGVLAAAVVRTSTAGRRPDQGGHTKTEGDPILGGVCYHHCLQTLLFKWPHP